MNTNLLSKCIIPTRLLLSCLIFVQMSVFAAPFSLEYQGFYQRLKKVNLGHFQLIEMAFLVPNKTLCRIKSGNIATEKHIYPLTYNDDQQLYLPFDAQLKRDRALINMDIEGNARDCRIMMQIRGRQLKSSYKATEMKQIQNEMNRLLKSLQGFPMKYFYQPITGVNIEFDEPTQVTIDDIQVYIGKQFHLGSKTIEQLSQVSFSHKPKLISPWLEER
ncbi:DUF2987 domain-containing protein [uncultured Shewanella sp.]|uniref:DUF2987 domain-containing protein n=1 Tax=uncultured Shewanella sp. TaxID=173975 RepID=UPI0026073704|nr:DUF2987 domain-containing protein [uncultured Shewanella sp.]